MTARIFLASLLLGLSVAARATENPARFNIISIVTDDQAHWSIGAYGNRESRTPHMDRLAREGALFHNAFVATPVCSPSRVSFLTGLYGTQVEITDWITPDEAGAGKGLPPAAITWPEVLQQRGYRTALIGKWHLGTQPHRHPTRHGFDHFYGILPGGTRPMDPTFEVNGEIQQMKGSCPDLLTDNALQFIDQNRSRPFALLLHFRAPHLPYGPVPDEDAAPFAPLDPAIPDYPGLNSAQVKRWTRDYYASIHSVDRNFGRLLARLDESGLARRTIILFTSDHGYQIGHNGLHGKGNASWVTESHKGQRRPNMFENSIRVPLLIRWPGVIKPGTEIRQMVSNIDTFPTVLGMLGIGMPADVRQHGVDFSPLLRGKSMRAHDAIFSQYDMQHGAAANLRMVRESRWKLVRNFAPGAQHELYDLESDPDETRNLYSDPSTARTRARLEQRLERWQESIADPLLFPAARDISRR